MADSETLQTGIPKTQSRWARLLQDLQGVDGSLDLCPLLQHLLKLVQQVKPEQSAGFFLLDEETRTIQGQVTDLFDRELHEGEGALLSAMHSPSPFMISNLPAETSRDRRRNPTRSQITVPFQASPRVRGALILRSRKSSAFSEEDGQRLSEFALQAAGLIENALIHQKMVQVGDLEVERDMVMAQEIMARLIPQQPPKILGFDVANIYLPAKIVGGDLLDYIVLLDDHYGFLVADAAGNGVPAALLMTGFRALFRGLIQNDFNIRSVFRKANQQLLESTGPHQFVSAFYAALDATTGRLIYVNGGHVPPLLHRPSQSSHRLEMGGPVLGVLPAASYHEDSIVLHPGDILVCYSDGLSEVENSGGEAFDAARILRVVEQNQDRSAEAICTALQEEAGRFGGFNFRDDLTISVVKFL